MKRLFLLVVSLVVMAQMSMVEARNRVYQGEIGPYKIHMVLDDNYNGYYYYDRNPKSKFTLRATRNVECSDYDYDYDGIPLDGCFRVTLQEYAPGSGKNSGEFVGKFGYKMRMGNMSMFYNGTFRNKSNGKTYNFSVGRSEQVN